MSIAAYTRSLGLAVIFILGLAAPAKAADYFLKIDTIAGDSADANHIGEIAISSFTSSITPNIGLGSVTRTGTNDMTFTSQFSKASPALAQACALGTHIGTAVFSAVNSQTRKTYYKITMTDALVSSYKFVGPASDVSNLPTDQFSLNFTKIEFEYTFASAGSIDQVIRFNWDLKRSKLR